MKNRKTYGREDDVSVEIRRNESLEWPGEE